MHHFVDVEVFYSYQNYQRIDLFVLDDVDAQNNGIITLIDDDNDGDDG